MAIKTLNFKNLVWVDVDESNDESVKYLKDNFRFHPLDFEDVLGKTQRPKVDVYKNYLFSVFHFPVYDKKSKRIITSQVSVFIGQNYLVTVHNHFRPIKNFYYRLKNVKYKRESMDNGSGFLLYKVLEALFKTSFPITDQIGLRISKVEEKIYEGERIKTRVRELGEIKRNILNFRKIIDPQRFTINTLVHIKKPFLPEELSVYYDNIHDYIENLWSISENHKDMIDSLHVTTESLISQKTNEVIKALTIISVSLMPLTLLSGIYGMNIKGLPFADHPSSIWLIFGVMLLVIAGAIGYFRKKDWL